jgi:uncharacterized protein
MSLDLTAVETRLLGCLLEKERTTPEAYPLTLNSLVAAANQTTNRDPVLSLDNKEVEQALDSLRAKKLAAMVMMAGARAPKYRHQLPDHYEFTPAETALVCVLMLRGPQTVGELKPRTERLHVFRDSDELEHCLKELAGGDDPVVRQLAPQPGRKGIRWVQLLSGEPDPEMLAGSHSAVVVPAPPAAPSRVDELEKTVQALREELDTLRREFEEFRGQF